MHSPEHAGIDITDLLAMEIKAYKQLSLALHLPYVCPQRPGTFGIAKDIVALSQV